MYDKPFANKFIDSNVYHSLVPILLFIICDKLFLLFDENQISILNYSFESQDDLCIHNTYRRYRMSGGNNCIFTSHEQVERGRKREGEGEGEGEREGGREEERKIKS